jgi:hypothetical protein
VRAAGGALAAVSVCCLLVSRHDTMAMETSHNVDAPVQQRPRTGPGGCDDGRGGIAWAAMPQDLLEHVLGRLPLRSVAAAARTCKRWAPVGRVVQMRARLEEALIEPEEIIWRRYSGGAERMGREGFTRFVEEVCGWAEGFLDDANWGINTTCCGGTTAEGIGRAGFVHGMYVKVGRNADADADALTDEAALWALVVEAKACGPSLRVLREALEARLTEAARNRPLWTVTVSQLVEVLVSQWDNVDTVRRCCQQLNQRLGGGQPANMDAAEVAGVSQAVIVAVQAHITDAEVQRWGCAALAKLARNHPASQTAAATAGGIEAVVAAMQTHPGAEVVQANGCGALGNLMCDHPANQTAAAAAGGIEAVVAAIRAHPGAEDVQANGCWALGDLMSDHPANQIAAAAAGGIEAVMAAMQTHPGAEAVQANGCGALGNLMSDHPANQTTVAAVGGIEVVVAAMRAHPGAEAVQNDGCWALGSLVSAHSANQTEAAAVGGIEVVVAAMRAHPGAEDVQVYGCCALGYLMRDYPANRTTVAAAGGIEAVMAAMRAHPVLEALAEALLTIV